MAVKSFRNKPKWKCASKYKNLRINPYLRSFSVSRPVFGRSSLFAGAGVGLGQSLTTVLKTVIYAEVSTTAGGVFSQYLMPGSAYQPMGSITTVQPQLFDQYALIYGRYVVLGATVKIEPSVLSSGSSNNSSAICCYPSNSSTSLATFQAAASQPYAISKLLTTWQSSAPGNHLYASLDHKKVLGRREPVNAEDNGALVTASPTTNQFMVLPIYWQHENAETCNGSLLITMYQTVRFDRRKNVVDA